MHEQIYDCPNCRFLADLLQWAQTDSLIEFKTFISGEDWQLYNFTFQTYFTDNSVPKHNGKAFVNSRGGGRQDSANTFKGTG